MSHLMAEDDSPVAQLQRPAATANTSFEAIMATLLSSSDSNADQLMERQPLMLPQMAAAQHKNQPKTFVAKAPSTHSKKGEYKVRPAQFSAGPITSLFQMADPSFTPVPPAKHLSARSLASELTQTSLPSDAPHNRPCNI